MSEGEVLMNLMSEPNFSSADDVSACCYGLAVDDLAEGSSSAPPHALSELAADVTHSTEGTGVEKLMQLCGQLRRHVDEAYEIVAGEARGYYDMLIAILEERKKVFLDQLDADKQRRFFVAEVENFVKEHERILESDPAAFEAAHRRLQQLLVSMTDPNNSWFGVKPNTTIIKELSSGKDIIYVNQFFSCFFHTRKLEDSVRQLKSMKFKNPATPEPPPSAREKTETEDKTSPARSSERTLPAAEAPGEIESVRILSVKSPQEFYVLRRSDKDLWASVNSYFQHQTESLAAPETVELGQIYAACTFDETCNWYRGRAGRRCGYCYVGSVAYPLYDFFLVDMGSSADIRLCDIRVLDGDILNIPPLAKPCSLLGICPREGTTWSREACQEFLDVVTKGPVGMRTFHEEGGVYYVDLSVIISDDKSIPSVRDLLMLRRLSSLPSSGNEPKLKQLTSQAKHIRSKQTFQAIASYCESPDIVYFQRMDQAHRILDMQQQLQETYSNPTTSYTAACFDPRKGLLCAALYEGEYYRALVEDVDPDGRVAIFYVDYGNREKVYAGELRELAPRFAEMEAQGIRCSVRKTGTPSQVESLMAHVANNALCCLEVINVLKGHVGKVGNAKEFCLTVEINLVNEGAALQGEDDLGMDIAGLEEARHLDTVSPVSESMAKPLDQITKVDTGLDGIPAVCATTAASGPVEAVPDIVESLIAEEEDRKEDLSPMDEYSLQCLYKHSDSPSLIYVTLPAVELEFQELDDRMQDFYKDRPPLPFSSLAVGGEYCVQAKGRFCRGRIHHITDEESVGVFFIDYGQKRFISAGSFFQLEEEHRRLASGLIACELHGIEPESFHWKDEAIAAVHSILVESVYVHIRARGKPRRLFPGSPAALPVELTVETGSPECPPFQFSLNEYLVRQGWAKFTQDQQITRWIAAAPPKREIFDGLVTWITYEGNIFIQDQANADLVLDMSRRLRECFQNSQPDPDAKWSRGDVCIAWFEGDGGWHRANLISCPPLSYRVFFVDFGTSLNSAVEELRKPPAFIADVPVQVWECKLHDINPPDGSDTWPEAVLDQIHALLIEKFCVVRLHRLGSNPPYDVSLTLSDGRDVGALLVEMGLASFAPKLGIPHCPLPSEEEGTFPFPVTVADVKGLRLTILPDVGIPVDEKVERLDVYKKWVEAQQKVEQMHMDLDRKKMSPLEEVLKGTICLVRNEGHFSRGVVLESDGRAVTVELVDVGTVVETAASELFQLPQKYVNIPQLSFAARLCGLELAPGVSMETATRKLTKAAIKYPLWALFKGRDEEQASLIDLLAFDAEEGKQCLAYESYVKKGIFQRQPM